MTARTEFALKEWAGICAALAAGRQSLLFRKGGIAEDDGVFKIEHDVFWLYPTHFHESQQKGLKQEWTPSEAPTPGKVRLSHYAEVDSVHYLTDLNTALSLDAFHLWTPETIRQRFEYRSPGLFLIVVTVWQNAIVHEIAEQPQYVGCKSWVTLDDSLEFKPKQRVVDPQRAELDARLAEMSKRIPDSKHPEGPHQ